MRTPRFMQGILSAVLAVGLCAGVASATTSAVKKSSGAKTRSVAHRTTSSKKATKRSRGRERGQMAPTVDRVIEIQHALAKDGSFNGAPNGKWDGATVEAMKRFQAGHGLNPSGKLDAKSLQRLGLGSQTAGIAPPNPTVTSSPVAMAGSPDAARRRN